MVRVLEEVTRHDRFQASVGIERAADDVAATAEEAGLEEVAIHYWQTDGSPQWWSFAGPPPWTPESASLSISSAGRKEVEISYPADSFAVGTYSCGTSSQGMTYRLRRASELEGHPTSEGTMALVEGGYPREDQLDLLWAHGVRGLACCPDWPTGPIDRLRRRIELPFGSRMFAFSLSTEEMRRLSAIDSEMEAHARLAIRRSGRMPVVTGLLRGRTADELLVLSHLCHPRPSANDNGSGVAASLAIASCLSDPSAERRCSVRFIWGPEFVGTVAYLHDLVQSGVHSRPVEAINLDVVGQEEASLRLEHPPAHLAALLPAVVERCLASPEWETNARGKVTAPWEPAPFTGTSDHAVLVDHSIGVPATHIGQVPDHFNHSSGDSCDRIDMRPLRLASVSVAAAIETLSQGPEPGELARWLHESAVRRGRQSRSNDDHYLQEGLRRSLAAIPATGASAQGRPGSLPASRPHDGGRDGGGRTLRPAWEGPFNLRSMLQRVPRPTRDALYSLLPSDRRESYTVMLCLALEISSGRPPETVRERASSLSGLEIGPDLAETFFDALCAADWAYPDC
ncbi:MAG TPA: DUF4910 domain-containing protein [Solirubrobacterales bacterium]|nr:DUF4910 domain-containing protein [Solirubrobacterales bacterium]